MNTKTAGRIVVFAGFTASIDRVCEIVGNEGWLPIRVDGRGWHSIIKGGPTDL
jgi:hypothetical protein